MPGQSEDEDPDAADHQREPLQRGQRGRHGQPDGTGTGRRGGLGRGGWGSAESSPLKGSPHRTGAPEAPRDGAQGTAPETRVQAHAVTLRRITVRPVPGTAQ
ncbi:hypothetical protein GCM10020295_26770 [Streptomyces cinereospinus]